MRHIKQAMPDSGNGSQKWQPCKVDIYLLKSLICAGGGCKIWEIRETPKSDDYIISVACGFYSVGEGSCSHGIPKEWYTLLFWRPRFLYSTLLYIDPCSHLVFEQMTLVGSTNLHWMWTLRIRSCWDALGSNWPRQVLLSSDDPPAGLQVLKCPRSQAASRWCRLLGVLAGAAWCWWKIQRDVINM